VLDGGTPDPPTVRRRGSGGCFSIVIARSRCGLFQITLASCYLLVLHLLMMVMMNDTGDLMMKCCLAWFCMTDAYGCVGPLRRTE